MSGLSAVTIDLDSLEAGKTVFRYTLGSAFFQARGTADIHTADVAAEIDVLRRTGDVLDMTVRIKGVVGLPCDRCLDDMMLSVAASRRVTVTLGDAWAEDGDTVTVAAADGTVDVSWLVYEFTVLSIPLRHVHENGGCNAVMTATLRRLTATTKDGGQEGRGADPRWSRLSEVQN